MKESQKIAANDRSAAAYKWPIITGGFVFGAGCYNETRRAACAWDGYDLSLMVHFATLFDFVVNLKSSESRIHSWISSLWGLTFANKGDGFKLKYCDVRYSTGDCGESHFSTKATRVFSSKRGICEAARWLEPDSVCDLGEGKPSNLPLTLIRTVTIC